MKLQLATVHEFYIKNEIDDLEEMYKKEPRRKLYWPSVYYQEFPALLSFTGTVATDGINRKEWEEKKGVPEYSIGIQLSALDLAKMVQILDWLFSPIQEEKDDWSITEPFKGNNVLYFKIRMDKQGKPKPRFHNTKINQKDPSKSPILKNQQVEVTFSLSSYFDFEMKSRKEKEPPTRQCGPVFNASEFTFIKDTEE